MTKNLYVTLIVLLTFVVSSCDSKKVSNSQLLKINADTEILEYSVYNQTLSLLGENILFNKWENDLFNEFEFKLINEKLSSEDRLKFFERLKKESIDTSKISPSKIHFLILPDSLTRKGDLESRPISIDRINHPIETILINPEDSIRKLNYHIRAIKLSRVIFNSNRTEAEFEFGIIRGPMNENGYLIKCKLKNGAWVVVEKKVTWVS